MTVTSEDFQIRTRLHATPEGERFAVPGAMAFAQASNRTARRWLCAALIVWLGGAAVGVASLPKRTATATRPDRPARPPAHRPVDIAPPSFHDLPAVA
jgi:hypothetical protein